jgi:transcription elongation factor Elf1/flagellar basal body-associated protein FliL
MKIFVRILMIAAIAAGIGYCIHLLGAGNLTPRESGLLSIVLTGLSILASWIVSDMYSASQHKTAIAEVQEAHRTNLRTYALKAAEKVTNLSNELSRLSTYLQQELDYTDYRNTEEELQAKEERLESAIHLLSTLKSVNDTSLSDWQGVIGDELAEQREEMHEREQEWRETLMDIERQLAMKNIHDRAKSDPNKDAREEMEALRREIRLAASAISGVSLPFHRASKNRQMIELPCTRCGNNLKYRQAINTKSIKGVKCPVCETRFVARYDEIRGAYLIPRIPVEEKFICPSCGAEGTLALDPVPSGNASGECRQCGQGVTLTRAFNSVRVRLSSHQNHSPEQITPELIEKVRMRLPKQPWPTGVHREIASELGISPTKANRAIYELIKMGEYSPQEYGVVLDPDQCENRNSDDVAILPESPH